VQRALKDVLAYEPTLAVVGEAASAEDALAKLGDKAPDLCLIDFSLPGVHGVELIRRLSRTYPNTRCLMVSSHYEQF
jgi:DNA-binding NarL/FixJ family response regulator